MAATGRKLLAGWSARSTLWAVILRGVQHSWTGEPGRNGLSESLDLTQEQ